jgi:hypothetical protein
MKVTEHVLVLGCVQDCTHQKETLQTRCLGGYFLCFLQLPCYLAAILDAAFSAFFCAAHRALVAFPIYLLAAADMVCLAYSSVLAWTLATTWFPLAD